MTTGRNRSLLASLDYSLQRLGEEPRALLLRLAPFDGGANEDDLLAITEIPEPAWVLVRSELERAALLTVEPIHKSSTISFLHFHPLLVPYLRGQAGALDADLQTRYAWRYHERALQLYFEDDRNPQAVRALARRELPNLMRALSLLSQAGELRAVSEMVNSIVLFLGYFGLQRERDQLRQQEAVALASAQPGAPLTYVEWLYESGLAQEKYNSDVHASYNRFMALLKRIEALPEGITLGPGSYQHCTTLDWVARCLNKRGQPTAAETRIREALSIIDERHDLLSVDLRGVLYSDLGHTLRDQGRYSEAREAYEESSRVAEGLGNKRAGAGQLMHLGALSVDLWEYPEARSYFSAALELFKISDELEGVVGAWFELGVVAEHQKEWAEAERCFREALVITEQQSEDDRAASCCNWLARIALATGRTAEAEGWWKRSVEIIERMHPGGPEHAGYLTNLVFLLLNEVRAGHAQERQERLAEARDYAERALRMRKALEASEEIWTTLQMLADIADAEGWTAAARDYRRQARETFAALESKRYHMDRVFGEATDDIAAVASGDLLAWASAEAELRNLEGAGLHIAEAVQRIRAGERDWHLLVEGMEPPAALLVLLILEKITQPGNVQPAEALNITPLQVLASLPITVREAFERRDIAAIQQALGRLSSAEVQRRVSAAIRYLFSDEGSASYIDPHVQESERVLQGIAAVATGESTQRDMLEAALIELEETTGSKLRECVKQIWEGERDESTLTAGLNRVDAAMVRRAIEIIAERSAMQKMSEAELIASLPETTRGALERGENVAFEQALEGLLFNERQRVRTALYYLKLKLEEGERERGAQDIDALVREAEPWLDRLAAVALGNPTYREKAEEFLSGLEARGYMFPERVQRIWQGARDEVALLSRLGGLEAALTRRLLEDIVQTMSTVQQGEPWLQAMAAVALGDSTRRDEVEGLLGELEARGYELRERVQRIWEGERDEAVLFAELGALDTALLRRVLAFIAQTVKIARSFESLLQRIAAVATGDEVHRSEIEAALADQEENGLQLARAVWDIWEGERNERALTAQLPILEVIMVRRVLEIMAQTTAMRKMTEAELIAFLPETIHGAFIAGDLTAVEQAFGVLSFEEQERVKMVMLHLKILREKDAVQRFEPLLQKIAAVASGDVARRSEIEAELADLEREGWQLTEVVKRIWAGERDEITLISQLNREDFQVMALVYRVLEILALERTDRR